MRKIMRQEIEDSRHSRSGEAGTGHWGSFLLAERGPGVLLASLHGRLNTRHFKKLTAALLDRATPGAGVTVFLLDVSRLEHQTAEASAALATQVARWRSLGIVACWTGMTPYFANLIDLHWGLDESLPAFRNAAEAIAHARALGDVTAGIARERLLVAGELRA